VSGAGKKAIEDLVHQTSALLNGKPVKLNGANKQIAFNAIPHIDTFLENRYTKEEMKMVWETQKILDDKSIMVNPTAVRIPVFYGHSEAVHLETKKKISQQGVVDLMMGAPGVEVIDGVELGQYPTAVSDGSGTDPVYVGRIREDISHPCGINMWIVADNIRKGAALNTIQIAELLVKEYL
jgi:aspartate-semialdehyde dehydrogenase